MEAVLQGLAAAGVPVQAGPPGARVTCHPDRLSSPTNSALHVQRVASDLSRSVHMLESLRDMFEYKDPQGRDHVSNCSTADGVATVASGSGCTMYRAACMV